MMTCLVAVSLVVIVQRRRVSSNGSNASRIWILIWQLMNRYDNIWIHLIKYGLLKWRLTSEIPKRIIGSQGMKPRWYFIEGHLTAVYFRGDDLAHVRRSFLWVKGGGGEDKQTNLLICKKDTSESPHKLIVYLHIKVIQSVYSHLATSKKLVV